VTGFTHELVAGSRDVGDGHVDHAVFPAYVGRVRAAFLHETVPDLETYDRPVARLKLDYHAEVFAGERLVGEAAVCSVGESSLTTKVTLRRGEETVATAKTVQVVVDPETDEPTSVPESWRDALG
jgi:acyl-CoA thioester hydrolase